MGAGCSAHALGADVYRRMTGTMRTCTRFSITLRRGKTQVNRAKASARQRIGKLIPMASQHGIDITTLGADERRHLTVGNTQAYAQGAKFRRIQTDRNFGALSGSDL